MVKMFPEQTNWYKGNLHSHTTDSDGTLTPEEAVKAYREHGYSVLCLSDHNVFSDYREKYNREDFLILPGTEIAAVLFDEKDGYVKMHHMNGILGTEAMQKAAEDGLFSHMERIEPIVAYGSWDGRKVTEQMAENLRRHGCFITYNHPIWSRVEPQEFELEGVYHSLEIYNYNTVNESGTGYNITYWDEMLRKGMHVNADATDDNHNGDFPDNFGGYVVIAAESLTHDHIIEALLSGRYYSVGGPDGPSISQIAIDGNEVTVSCSPVERVNIIAGGYVGAGKTILAEAGKTITEAHATLSGTETYIRVECVDQYGRTAWSNPYYFKREKKAE